MHSFHITMESKQAVSVCNLALIQANLDKCKVMHIGNTLNAVLRSRLELSEVEFEKDLGMWTNSSMKSSL